MRARRGLAVSAMLRHGLTKAAARTGAAPAVTARTGAAPAGAPRTGAARTGAPPAATARRLAALAVTARALAVTARELAARAGAPPAVAARTLAVTARALAVTARALPARGTAVLRAPVVGMIALIAGASAVLVSLVSLASGAASALATVAAMPRNTLASVIPSTAIPQSRVAFTVYCTNPRTTSATLLGRTLGLTERIKMRPNTAAGDFTVSVTLPGSIRPGTYHPSIECSDGTATTARLLVPAFATGGTSGGVGTWLTAGGLILIGLGTVTGSLVQRRRRSARPDQSDQEDETELSVHSDRFDYSSHSNFRFLAHPH